MPTLLSINNYHYRRGGSEVVYLEQNTLFEEIDWTVASFSMQHENNEPSAWSDYFVEEIELGSEYSLLEKFVRIPKVIYSFEAREKLNRLLDKIRPDVAHAHCIYHHISPSVLPVLSARGIPTVLTLHDLKLACPAYLMYTHDGVCERCNHGRIYNVALHRCIKGSLALSTMIMLETAVNRALGSYKNNIDRLIAPSRFFKQKMADWGWDDDRIEYIPNFVYAERFEPGDAAGSGFLYFGRLSHEKGIETLVRAAAQAKVPLRIAGTGPMKAKLMEVAEATGADVDFLGFLSGDALHEAIRQARAVVLPSEWYENAPMSVMESYALGTPLIGADIGGIPELLREDETGFTVASGDVDALAGSLARVAAMPDATLIEMGRTARNWVERDFSAGAYRNRLLDLYRRLGADIG